MGTRMALSYSNICKFVLTGAPGGLTPLLYRRFIDDIFGIWLHGEKSLLQFLAHANNCHPDTNFTNVHGKSVPYLDVYASLNGHITTDLYCKLTDTRQYLLPSSNHPAHVHKLFLWSRTVTARHRKRTGDLRPSPRGTL